MARTYEFVVGKAEAGLRLDRYLVRHLPTMVSRSMIQRAVRAGQVTVSNRSIKAHYKLHLGDGVHAHFEELPAPSKGVELVPQPIPLDIVFEDGQVLVVNKPPGLVTHPAPGHWDGTLVNAILWHLEWGQGAGDGGRGKRQDASEEPTPHAPPARRARMPGRARPTPPLARAGIVHRLDKDTSGLLIVAKTATAHARLSKQLKQRLIKRRYLALVEGRVPLERGTVDAPIARHRIHRKEMAIRHLGGRSAITHYRVIKRFGAGGAGQGLETTTFDSPTPHAPPARRARMPGRARPTPPFLYTLLEVSLETGRTHQIRVHMAHLGHPVLGDVTYGRRSAEFWRSVGIARQLLHAYAISFTHPTTRQPVTLTAPIPDDLRRWIGTALEGTPPHQSSTRVRAVNPCTGWQD